MPKASGLPYGVVRVPLLGLGWARRILAISAGDAREEQEAMREIVEEARREPGFWDALGYASPSLRDQWLRRGAADPAACAAIARYVLRAATRTTPHGLFAKTGAVRWSGEGPISPPDLSRWFAAQFAPDPRPEPCWVTDHLARRNQGRIIIESFDGKDQRSLKYDDRIWAALRDFHAGASGAKARGGGADAVEALRAAGLLAEKMANPLRGLARRLDMPGRPVGEPAPNLSPEAFFEDVLVLPRALLDRLVSRIEAMVLASVRHRRALNFAQYAREFFEQYYYEPVRLTDLVTPGVAKLPPPWVVAADPSRPEAPPPWMASLFARGMTNLEGAELALDMIEAPAGGEADRPVPGCDGSVLLLSASHESLAKGEYGLFPSGGSPACEPYQYSGRFMWGLPEPFVEHVLQWQREVESSGQVVHAEMVGDAGPVFAPFRRTRHGWSTELVFNGAPLEPGRRYLRPEDVLVRTDRRGGLELWTEDGERLVVHKGHMHNAARTPPAMRLLWSLSLGTARTYMDFNWGPLEEAPVLPRVTFQGQVLHLKRWSLDVIPERSLASRAAFLRWCAEMQVPALCSLRCEDTKLPINAGSHWGFHEVVRARRSGNRHFLEELPWSTGETAHSPVLLDLIPAVAFRQPEPNPRPGPVHLRAAQVDRRWTTATFVLPDQHVRSALRVAVQQLRGRAEEAWHFVRMGSEAAQELRIRWLGRCELNDLTAWAGIAEQHAGAQLTLREYWPETMRYGGDPAIHAAHGVFTADSELALSDLWEARAQATLLGATAHAQALILEHALGVEEALRACRGLRSGEGSLLLRKIRSQAEVAPPDAARDERLGACVSAWAAQVSGEALNFGARSLAHMAANRRLGPRRDLEDAALGLAESILFRRKQQSGARRAGEAPCP